MEMSQSINCEPDFSLGSCLDYVGKFVISILGNGLTGLTHCMAWTRNQKQLLLDFILTSLAFPTISHWWLTVVILFSVCSMGRPLILQEEDPVLTRIWMLTKYLSIWFPTCLLSFAPEDHQFLLPPFLGWKWRISKLVFLLPLVSVPFLTMSFLLPYSFGIFWYLVQKKKKWGK